MKTEEEHRCGYVALVGRPNVGKSTILNQLLGLKIAATTHKPQTTRRNLLGILHAPNAQILLVDTPGFHKAKGPLNRFMVREVEHALMDTHVVGYVVEARDKAEISPGNERLIEALKKAKRPVVLLINKIDRLKDKQLLLPLLEVYREALGDVLVNAVPLSATKRDGLDRVVDALGSSLPVAPAVFADDEVTNAPERVIVAEMIREKVMLETQQELPYAVAISIEMFEDKRPKIVRIMATIHVERKSQQGIVIGNGGERLKAIGTRAREEIEHFVECKVFLDLHVRTTERWSDQPDEHVGQGYRRDGA